MQITQQGKLIELLSDYSPVNVAQVAQLRLQRAQQTIADMYILKNTPPPTFKKFKNYHLSRLRYFFKFNF